MEFGAGTGRKSEILLRAAAERQSIVHFYPVDLSWAALEAGARRIRSATPRIQVCPILGPHESALPLLSKVPTRKLALIVGSSLGNLTPRETRTLLEQIRQMLSPGDAILIGVDLVKDMKTMLAAYDDPRGVTAAFSLNVVHRLNREAGARFQSHLFRHCARWNEQESAVEMHLESQTAQWVLIAALGKHPVSFVREESIRTESSRKFSPAAIRGLLDASGFECTSAFVDEACGYLLQLAIAGR